MAAGRATWHARANAVVLAYLAAAVVAIPVHAAGDAGRWLPVHLFLLGAVTNAVVIWTGHFTATLLRAPRPSGRAAAWRMAGLNVAVIALLIGVTGGLTVVTVIAAGLLAVVIAAHLTSLVRVARRGRGGSFAPTVWFYGAAAAALLAGVAAGTALVAGVPPGWYAHVYAAHVHLNVFGWVALAVLGTEFGLWPMALRTRVDDRTARAARRTLPACTAGLTITVAGLLADARPITVAGLVVYLAGVAMSLDPFVRTAWRRHPRGPATWMLAAGTGWLLIALGADVAAVLRTRDVAEVADRVGGFVPWLLAGFVAQVLAGALTYLLPVVLGRGPAGARRAVALLDRWGAARTVGINAGVAAIALPLPTIAAAAGWALAVASLAAFVGLAAAVVVITRRGPTAPVRSGQRPVRHV